MAGTSVTQIEATYAHLFGEHLERSRVALEVSTPVVLRRVSRENERGWTARLTVDDEVAVYCPVCDKREFGGAGA